MPPDRVGHTGEMGRWFDNAPDVTLILRPRSTPLTRRALVLMPVGFAAAMVAGLLGLGVLIGYVAS